MLRRSEQSRQIKHPRASFLPSNSLYWTLQGICDTDFGDVSSGISAEYAASEMGSPSCFRGSVDFAAKDDAVQDQSPWRTTDSPMGSYNAVPSTDRSDATISWIGDRTSCLYNHIYRAPRQLYSNKDATSDKAVDPVQNDRPGRLVLSSYEQYQGAVDRPKLTTNNVPVHCAQEEVAQAPDSTNLRCSLSAEIVASQSVEDGQDLDDRDPVWSHCVDCFIDDDGVVDIESSPRTISLIASSDVLGRTMCKDIGATETFTTHDLIDMYLNSE